MSDKTYGRYFETHYPYNEVAALLRRTGPLVCREFAAQGGEGDYWRRHLHPTSRGEHVEVDTHAQEIRHELRTQELKDGRRIPFALRAIHIGAVFSREPAKGSKTAVPQRRELTVDLDLTDYPHRHLDKRDVAGCDAAWPMIAFGLDLLGAMLEQQFGYTEFVRWYSGRRGAHLWVLDEHACALSQDGRAAVEGFCNLRCDRNGAATEDVLTMARNYELYDGCHAFFTTVGLRPRSEGGLGLLDNDPDVRALFEATGIRHPLLQDLPDRVCALSEDGTRRWDAMVMAIEQWADKLPWAIDALRRAMLAWVWPRMDAKVTTGLNHTVKAPFSMHSATGRICVPIFDSAYDFSPSATPTGDQVVHGEGDARARLNACVQRLRDEVVLRSRADHPTKGRELPPLERDPEEEEEQQQEHQQSDMVTDMEDIGGPFRTLSPDAPARRPEIAMVEVEYAVERNAWFLKVDRIFSVRFSGTTLTMSVQWSTTKENAFIGRFGQTTRRMRVRSEEDTVAATRLMNCVKRMQTGATPPDRWVRVIRDWEVYMVLSDQDLRPRDVKERFLRLQEGHCNKYTPVATMDLFRHPMPMRSHFETLLNRYRDWVILADE